MGRRRRPPPEEQALLQAELDCCGLAPQWLSARHGPGFSLYTCKTRSNRRYPLLNYIRNAPVNCVLHPACSPVARCSIGTGPINEFVFSPCGRSAISPLISAV